MYNIDKFVKEKKAVLFNNQDEMRTFQKDCENYNKFISFSGTFLDRDIDNTYIICWSGHDDLMIKCADGRDTPDNIRFFLKHGYEIINVNELIATINFPPKDILMEFLGE